MVWVSGCCAVLCMSPQSPDAAVVCRSCSTVLQGWLASRCSSLTFDRLLKLGTRICGVVGDKAHWSGSIPASSLSTRAETRLMYVRLGLRGVV